MILRSLAVVLPLGFCLAGCASANGSITPGTSSVMAPAAPVTMPSGMASGLAAEAQPQRSVLAFVPNTGFVRGTPEALATVGRPLPEAEGLNRTVEPCRAVIESEAVKLGARQVEAASAGPHRRDARGRYVGPVTFRITYERPASYEVRLATLTCVVDRAGNVVDAFV